MSLTTKLLIWKKSAFLAGILLLCLSSGNLSAQEKPKPEEPKINPLEIKVPDPLLPQLPNNATLSQEQQAKLKLSLEELNTQAAALLKAGKTAEAWEVWYREMRLRRALGYWEEVQALGRFGEIAWQNNQKFDVQLITARLIAIQKEAEEKKSLNLKLLQALGTAYQQVRVPGPAVTVYQQILADARQRQDSNAQGSTLNTIAQLYLAWFDYPNAAKSYEELLAFAKARGDSANEVVYLKQLVYIYTQAKQYDQALRVKEQLEKKYIAQQDLTQLAPLKIEIASDYEALNQPDKASKIYQEAYAQASSLRQLAYASEALRKLGTLYRTYNQPEFALQVYDILLKVEEQSVNSYGLMYAYDQIGQIHLAQKNYAKALAAFKEGLGLAKLLQYQESYFNSQIERVNKQN
jgi:tetratricopeptide (TPR) repeat protein